MLARTCLLAALALLPLAACVPTDRPSPATPILSVEEMKKDVAVQRNRGRISFEEAARQQFEIERGSYSLTAHQLDIWRTAILYARQYDAHQISLADYDARRQALFADYLAAR